ncbi:HIRAN domain-containing protein [Methanobrevibacter thaueri]|uniref:Tetratricopeptide repeat protein n=1 Tax=Methanobrevibacter thaueri TaxID=190975 RepID=A0A315XP91_9EURY|nr:HIRAN domain-containing protein [Methanobrevibacter thaueri]PWB88237.1 tetratricopeptide repeat protein [Methanobrevibacter thaueri]
MGRDWQIGDPVDYTTDGWMDAQNWGHGSDDDDEEESGRNHGRRRFQDSRIKEYSDKAWDYYQNSNDENALYYINLALDLDDCNANNWNRKGIIVESLENYAEAEKCYNRSLELSKSNIVYDNKAVMLYHWAKQLIEESKTVPNGLDKLKEAMNIIIRAMRALPGEESEEDIEKYLSLRDSINFYIDYENRFQANLETLKKYDKGELFTITGMNFYKNDVMLTPGKPLELVKEHDNEFDEDAIAVYAEGKKIGFVANKDYTKFDSTSSASQLQDEIENVAQAEYLLYLDRYADIQFSIGRIIK